jgi:hypothetical protein
MDPTRGYDAMVNDPLSPTSNPRAGFFFGSRGERQQEKPNKPKSRRNSGDLRIVMPQANPATNAGTDGR